MSLDDEGREYQTRILTREDFDAIYGLVRGIHTESREPDKAGGTCTCAARAARPPAAGTALKGLSDQQARNLNMRHTSNNRWCELTHGDYDGKHTAVNGCHENTIELRTFARWDETTAHRLIPASNGRATCGAISRATTSTSSKPPTSCAKAREAPTKPPRTTTRRCVSPHERKP